MPENDRRVMFLLKGILIRVLRIPGNSADLIEEFLTQRYKLSRVNLSVIFKHFKMNVRTSRASG